MKQSQSAHSNPPILAISSRLNPHAMSTAGPASADADSKLEHQEAEIPSSSPLSLHSELDSPVKPVRPRRQAAANKRYTSPPRNEPKSIPQRQKKKPAAARRAVKKTKWDAESILKDPKSPLATANLRVCLTYLPYFTAALSFLCYRGMEKRHG